MTKNNSDHHFGESIKYHIFDDLMNFWHFLFVYESVSYVTKL